jgi:hypothetical protein
MGWGEAPSKIAMASYLFIWGLFTCLLFVGTLKLNRALQFVFASLTILFWMLALADATETIAITRAAGVVGIICGLSAIYAGIAQVLNEVYGRCLLPLGINKG